MGTGVPTHLAGEKDVVAWDIFPEGADKRLCLTVPIGIGRVPVVQPELVGTAQRRGGLLDHRDPTSPPVVRARFLAPP